MLNNENLLKKITFGIPEIDEQHKGFILLINKVREYLNENTVSDEILSEIMKELLEYSQSHLRYEEKLMMDAGYEDLVNHMEEHRIYEEKISEFIIEDGFKSHFLIDKITIFMSKWLLAHIVSVDAKYVYQIKKHLQNENYLIEPF